MTGVGWSFVEVAARLLERDERQAVLGDLVETGESHWQGLLGVLGLVFRREAVLWKSWRPWLAGFGVAFPSSLLLMGVSLSVSWSYLRLRCPGLLEQASLTRPSGFLVLMCQAFLLIGWSWTGGFVVGSISRRTLWASTVLCYSPCLFCLTRFRVESLSRFCLLLFLLPAIWWSSAGQHWWSPPRWTLNWALCWPAWYLVATARRFSKEAGQRDMEEGQRAST
jgi:hypothetical protein